MTIASFLLIEDDLDMCDAVAMHVSNAAMEAGYSDPPHEEARSVVLLWDAYGILGNGGFEYLLESSFPDRDTNLDFTTKAFRAIGADDVARALEAVRNVFPERRIPSEPRERIAVYQAVPKARRTALAESVWKARRSFVALMAEYIRTNQAAIEAALVAYDAG